MAGQKTISVTNEYRPVPPPPPPPPPPDYRVTGTVTPNCVGDYNDGGEFNGKRYYTRTDYGFYIYYFPFLPGWIINSFLGGIPINYWAKVGASPVGSYLHIGTNTGHPVVAIGV